MMRLATESLLLLARKLADPEQCALDQAIAEARKIINDGERLEAELGDLLQDELTVGQGHTPRLRRLLDLIAALDCDRSALQVRFLLLSHADSWVRSKAAVILGKADKNPAWIARRLMDADPRVQANLIESIWGIDTDPMRSMLLTAAASSNNRVMGNALVGLYRVGDPSSIDRVLAMADDEREAFRITARWVMGEVCDPRFLPWLNAAFRTDNPKCRATVIKSLTRIRRRVSEYETAGRLRLMLTRKALGDDGLRTLALCVFSGARDGSGPLTAMNFVLSLNGGLVRRYSVTRRLEPDGIATGFVLPCAPWGEPYAEALESGLSAGVAMKRRDDLWCVGRYGSMSGAPGEAVSTTDETLLTDHLHRNKGFLTGPALIRKVISGLASKDLTSPDIVASAEKLIEVLAGSPGARNLVVCFDPDRPPAADEIARIEAAAAHANVVIHGIMPDSAADVSVLRETCCLRGTFHAGPVDAIGARLAETVEGLAQSYHISFVADPPAESGAQVKVQVFSSQGWAEMEFAG